ncbi:MAG: sodium/solute symporter, partial [Pirellulales bacterium]|nr:sodium/solute symporter [Pirellulales bacterium]
VGMSLVVSDIGAKDMIGLAGDGYRYGLVMMNYDFIGCIFPLLVAAFLFMPFLWMAGVYTIPEYLGRRYNQYVRTLFAACWTCFMIGTLGIIFVSAAEMASELLGWQIGVGVEQVDWHFWVLVIATAVVVGLFTTVGGLKAVVITDSFSCVVLTTGAALICILGLIEVGGISGLQEKVAAAGIAGTQEETSVDAASGIEKDGARSNWTEHHFNLLRPADDPDYPWPAVLLGLGFVLGPAYWIGNQAIVQRTLGSKSQAQARASYLCCAAIKLIFPILLVVPGLIGLAMFHDKLGPPSADGWQGNRVLPLMVVELLPAGVLGLVIGAFLAGVLSNLDSYVNSASTLVVTDLYKPVMPDRPDEHYLAVGRWLTVIFLVAGVAVSYLIKVHFKTVFEAFQTILSLFQGPLLALLLLGMLTRRATQWGGFFGMLLGVSAAVAMHFARAILTSQWLGDIAPAAMVENLQSFVGSLWPLGFRPDLEISFLWVAWWSFAIAVVGTILISLFTKPYDRKRLEGLVCWIPVEKEAVE